MRNADLVEAHLRRLDDDSTLAFVADLWTARGYDTSRDGGVVVTERTGTTTTIGTKATNPSPDVLVVPSASRADDGDADAAVLDATDLAELLQYAVEPSVARDLCRRHLGASPAALRAPLGLRVRRTVRAAGAWTPVLVVLVVALAGATLVPALTGDPSQDSSADAAATPAGFDGVGADDDDPGAGADETGAYRPDEGVADVPGANRSGVTNVSALAAAHDAAVRNRSYALWYDESGPATWSADAPRLHRDVDITVADGRYRVVASESEGRSPSQSVARRVYYDGAAWYVAEEDVNGTTYRSVAEANGSTGSVGTNPFTFRETVVERYLSTPETRYAGYIDQEGDILYRFVGEGTPEGLPFDGVSDYRFFAVVDDSGLVVVGNVQFTRTVEGHSADVGLRWTYGGFDVTTVSPPTWYETEFDGGNDTNATGETRTPPE